MGIKLTINNFKKRANLKHNNKYDYSKVVYATNKDKVFIICPIHGKFEQRPDKHLSGESCPSCSRTKKISRDDFLLAANIKHKNKYDYSKVVYVTIKRKIKIICPIHGEFEQTPSLHLMGSGCRSCGYLKNRKTGKKTKEFIIDEFIKKHGVKYDYSKLVYYGANKKVTIICPTHGEFEQKAGNHLRGDGCPKCCGGTSYGFYGFIEKANLKHKNKYDYTLTHYTNSADKITITCPTHGEFEQKAANHLRGYGCPKCSGNKNFTTEEMVDKARKTHGKKYDYSKTVYKKNQLCEIIIICPKHGEFTQVAANHLMGSGCRKCKESKGETKIRVYLENKNISYIKEKKFSDCKAKRPLPFDYYLPEHNTCVEFQGQQHYMITERFGGKKTLEEQLVRDEIKKQYCKNKGIQLIIIRYDRNPTKVLDKYLNLI